MNWHGKGALAGLAVVLCACASYRPGAELRPSFNSYTPQQDVEIGRHAATQILSRVKVHPSVELQQYVDQIGARLGAVSASGAYPYDFTAIQDNTINAFALPGGPVFLNSGLIRAADNEAQVAGVVAHEIAHVALRHGTSQASRANLLQLPAALAGVALGGGLAGEVGRLGLTVALQGALLSYSRTAEAEADGLGTRIMAQAGYNPIEMAKFFRKLEGGEARAPEFLSDHPSPGNRIRNVQAEVRLLPSRTYPPDTSDRHQRMRRLAE